MFTQFSTKRYYFNNSSRWIQIHGISNAEEAFLQTIVVGSKAGIETIYEDESCSVNIPVYYVRDDRSYLEEYVKEVVDMALMYS